jgi:hypothetical protein
VIVHPGCEVARKLIEAQAPTRGATSERKMARGKLAEGKRIEECRNEIVSRITCQTVTGGRRDFTPPRVDAVGLTEVTYSASGQCDAGVDGAAGGGFIPRSISINSSLAA